MKIKTHNPVHYLRVAHGETRKFLLAWQTSYKLSWIKVIGKFSRLSYELLNKAEHFDFYAPVEVAKKFNLL